MSTNFNLVVLSGRLASDPKLTTFGDGAKVVQFTICVNRKWRTENGEDKSDATFINCEAWEKIAVLISTRVRKGEPLLVRGRLKQKRWVDQRTGDQRQLLVVSVDEFQFILQQKPGQPKDHQRENTFTPETAKQKMNGRSSDYDNDDDYDPPF